MSNPFVGEIRMFAGNFAPRGWALCHGQLLAVSQNDALFSLLGTMYGGDGRTTFGLPDLRGRLPLHAGNGPGLSPHNQGAKAGDENVTLTTQQIPSHNHTGLAASNMPGGQGSPVNAFLAKSSVGAYLQSPNPASIFTLAQNTISNTGNNQAHSNLMPFLCLNFIIALVGIYPSRS